MNKLLSFGFWAQPASPAPHNCQFYKMEFNILNPHSLISRSLICIVNSKTILIRVINPIFEEISCIWPFWPLFYFYDIFPLFVFSSAYVPLSFFLSYLLLGLRITSAIQPRISHFKSGSFRPMVNGLKKIFLSMNYRFFCNGHSSKASPVKEKW